MKTTGEAMRSTPTPRFRIAGTLRAVLLGLMMLGTLGLVQPTAADAQATQTTTLVGKGGMCLDVPYADASNGSDLWVWDCNGTDAQKFTYDASVKELRVLGKCLDIEGNERSGSDVQVTLCGYTGDLNWYATNKGEIRTERFPGLCLDMRNGSTERKTRVQMWDCNGTAAQRWSLDAPTQPAPVVSDTNPANGTATIDGYKYKGEGRQMIKGEITVNGNTYDYVSGGFNIKTKSGQTKLAGSMPAGEYLVTMRTDYPDEIATKAESEQGIRLNRSGMRVKDSSHSSGYFGYHFWLTSADNPSNKGVAYDSRLGRNRTHLLIHPDGGSKGTAGCIGVQGDAATQRAFYADMRAEIDRNNGTFKLTVG